MRLEVSGMVFEGTPEEIQEMFKIMETIGLEGDTAGEETQCECHSAGLKAKLDVGDVVMYIGGDVSEIVGGTKYLTVGAGYEIEYIVAGALTYFYDDRGLPHYIGDTNRECFVKQFGECIASCRKMGGRCHETENS